MLIYEKEVGVFAEQEDWRKKIAELRRSRLHFIADTHRVY